MSTELLSNVRVNFATLPTICNIRLCFKKVVVYISFTPHDQREFLWFKSDLPQLTTALQVHLVCYNFPLRGMFPTFQGNVSNFLGECFISY